MPIAQTCYRFRSSTLATILSLFVFSVSECFCSEGRLDQRSPVIDAADMFCGPRCVDYVLKHYEVTDSVGITELSRSLQGKEISEGATLDSLEEILNKHGVFTVRIGMAREARLDWDHPAIVHFHPEGKGTQIGHFVVRLPSKSRSTVTYWDGARGVNTIPLSNWLRRRSGSVLLTSPSQVDLRGKSVLHYAGVTGDTGTSRVFGACVFLIGVYVFWGAYFCRDRQIKGLEKAS